MTRRSARKTIASLGVVICILLLGYYVAPVAVQIIAAPIGNQNSFLLDIISYPPGALPEPWMLARVDLSDVGSTVTISFPQLLEDSQYDELGSEIVESNPERLNFVYIYNAMKNVGRLGVLTAVEENNHVACLTIYEPEWTGGEGLCSNLCHSFQAKIIYRVNITPEEAFIYFGNSDAVLVDTATYEDSVPQVDMCFYGLIAYSKEGDKGQPTGDIKERITYCTLAQARESGGWIMDITERYVLAEYLGI